jgi:hypothetical protein
MISVHKCIALCLAAFALAACGGGEKKPPTVGEGKNFAEVCDKANEAKRVAVEGFLRLPAELNIKTGFVLRLYPTTQFTGKPVGVSAELGSEPNRVLLMPKEFSDKDLKVKTADGQVAGFGTKVRVSGDVYYPLVGQEFPCALSNPLVELAK